ncbi:hypothetical protein BJX99DRAFT_250804 [Aspergillus californicus]
MTLIRLIFPPSPTFVERDMPDLTGKVTIVIGATSEVGAISTIRSSAEYPGSRCRLEFLSLDLLDLSSIKTSADTFLQSEVQLDILIHNAGVMTPPPGSKTKLICTISLRHTSLIFKLTGIVQGHDLEMGTNALGPVLFNDLLLPLLQHTPHWVVVWVASIIEHNVAQGGIVLDKQTGAPKLLNDPVENYMESKVVNVFFASEMARRFEDGILNLSVHPGLMKTELQRHRSLVFGTIMGLVFNPPRYGAYIAAKFWAWCEKETAAYR